MRVHGATFQMSLLAPFGETPEFLLIVRYMPTIFWSIHAIVKRFIHYEDLLTKEDKTVSLYEVKCENCGTICIASCLILKCGHQIETIRVGFR